MGLIAKAPLLNSMLTICPLATIKLKEGDILTFGSWVCVADWDGVPHWYLANDAQLEHAVVLEATLREDMPECDSDTISGAYPTRRSTWVPVQTSTPIHDEGSMPIPRLASTPRRNRSTPTQQSDHLSANIHPQGRPTLAYCEIP